MIVKCINDSKIYFTLGKYYLVLEISINFKDYKYPSGSLHKRFNYRILDDENRPGVYNSDFFEIVSNNMDHFTFKIRNKDRIELVSQRIQRLELDKKHVDGFWGYFFDVSSEEEEEELMRAFVKELAEYEDQELVKKHKLDEINGPKPYVSKY